MRALLTGVTVAALAGLVGCSADEPEPGGPAPPEALPQSDEPLDLDPGEFTPEVTNPWFPLDPGTRWIYREITEEGEEVAVVVTATKVTHEVANGVTARVVRDTVTLDGEIIEDTFDWYAQDALGTVWYLGEDTAEFENGKVSTRAGSFEAGVDGAQPGVIMPASPELGMTYRQEYYQGEAEDKGEVLALGERARVPAGDYDDLVRTADTTPLEPDVLEHKYYADGVGLVLTVDKKGGGREELMSVSQVPAAEARRAGRVPLGAPY